MTGYAGVPADATDSSRFAFWWGVLTGVGAVALAGWAFGKRG
jgi:hypothetical protein